MVLSGEKEVFINLKSFLYLFKKNTKLMLVIGASFVLIFLNSCVNKVVPNDPEEKFGEEAVLIVEGEEIKTAKVYIMPYSHTDHLGNVHEGVYAQLPLTEIAKSFGAEVKIGTRGKVRIILPNDDYYVISLKNKTMRYKGIGFNQLEFGTGGWYRCKLYRDGELYVDDAMCNMALREMFGIIIDVNIDNGKVFVTKYSC